MNFIKKNWKWILVIAIIVIIFLVVKYKNRPVAVKVPEAPAKPSTPPAGKAADTTISIQAEAANP